MARKKRGSSKGSSGKGKPAVVSLGRGRGKRGPKARVGKTTRGARRKASAKSRVRGRRY